MFTGTFETETPLIDLVVRLGLAVLFGGLIGIERELKNRPAGLRTNMLVALAAATFTILAAELISESREATDVVSVDTLRIISAVINGVAFLGAGAIIRGGDSVAGLTTGASLWMSGAIGVACGGGYYTVAGVALFFSLVVLYLVHLVDIRSKKIRSE
jgi:putative Mg2+ transporter-C (MgtC) family protein